MRMILLLRSTEEDAAPVVPAAPKLPRAYLPRPNRAKRRRSGLEIAPRRGSS